MITKFRKLQDTWFAKSILILTGLSFVSLFGVAGYVGSIGKNRPVIKVDNYEMLQGEALAELDKEINMAKKLFGDGVEINDTVRQSILQDIVQKHLNNMIIRNMADKNSVSISDALVRQVIYSQPDFRDADGNFDINRLRQVLSASGWSEQQYIDSIKLDIIKQSVIQTPIEAINIPQIMLDYLTKIENQQRIFKYITLDINNLPIDRKISEDEIQQYYQDFSANFMAPETRDVSFFYMSNEDISKNVQPTSEEIQEYYTNNVAQFETPETRNVLQMIFEDEATAQKALDELNSGKDFYSVAEKLAKQDKATTSLGFVAKDMLTEDLADAVFEATKGKVIGPVQSDMGWRIAKVDAIKAGSKMNRLDAENKIKEAIRKEKAFDAAYELAAQIEDKIGAGETFETIASGLNTKIHSVKNLAENGLSTQSPAQFKTLTALPDFVDMAFSYNEGEISQVIELEDGFAVLTVDNIYDMHPKELDVVRKDIVKMWEANERTAIAQEITNDVMHDLESGDNIDEIASRFKLKLNVSPAVTRQQSFAGLNENDMNELFLENIGAPKIFYADNKEIIALTDKIINKDTPKADKDAIFRKAKLDLYQNYANRLLTDFSKDYDVRVKYRLLGLAD